MNSEAGKWIILIGAVILAAGIVIYFFHDKMNWIGRLPGDIRIEREGFRFYFPLTTMIILSVVITVFVRVFRKWMG